MREPEVHVRAAAPDVVAADDQEGMKEFGLGVLFVHGIGTQPWGDVLVRWGDSLVQTLARATRHEVVGIVEKAGPQEAAGGAVAEAQVRIESSDATERWLLREAWWAESFPPPTYRELVSWSVRALPWAVALHVARGYWRDSARHSKAGKVLAFLRAGGMLLVILPLTPLIVTLMGLTLLLGLLPPLRGWVASVQSVLTSTMGDSLAFVESPMRAALIRTRILDQLAALHARCRRTIVLAHSQGAAAVLDALDGIAGAVSAPGRSSPDNHRGTPPQPMPHTLVTYGAGINQLVSLRMVAAGLTPKPTSLESGSVLVVLASALFCGAMLAWLVLKVATGATTVANILLANVFVVVTSIVGLTVIALFFEWARARAAKSRRFRSAWSWTAGLGAIGLFVAMIRGFDAADDRLVDVDDAMLPILSVVLLTGATAGLLSKKLEESVTAPVAPPAALARWIDLYASADPVPNGPTPTRERCKPVSLQIWNRGSILTDHTSYWENADGFVLRIVNACAETADSSWKDLLAHPLADIDARACWRVRFLRLGRVAGVALWGAIAYLLFWSGQNLDVPVPSGVPDWIPDPVLQPSLLLSVVAAGAVMSHAVLFGIWRSWSAVEQRRSLGGDAVTGSGFLPLWGMGMVVWALAFGVAGLIWRPGFETHQIAVLLPLFSAAASAISVRLLLRWAPPPSIPAATARAVAPAGT